MKKILKDKSFWTILCICIVALVALTVGVVFLTRENAKEFYSAGYIIDSNTTKTDKYFFSDNTVYKENVFDEYVFTDVNDIEVSTSKENFIHYSDNSLSFMKNGVILDLDNFNENIVPYYNITDKSIVKYSNGGYYIETADKTLVFGNILGRITDNKYIVVGNDIKVKLSGNDAFVYGDFFEILFIEDGIVKIENEDSSYQTLSDGTVIYIGDNLKIDLGEKSVTYGDNLKISLSELTIDGNENIDIIPEGTVKEEDSNDNDTTGSLDGSENAGTTGDNTGAGTGNDGENGTGNDVTTVLKKEVSVNLISASLDSDSINTRFQVIDTASAIKGDLTVTLVNTSISEDNRMQILVNDYEEQDINFYDLKSDCNYVMTIKDESGVEYFQKSFRTESLDLRLKRELVTEDSLTYLFDFGDNDNVVSADVTLYDASGNKIKSHTVFNGSNDKIVFEGLTNNTMYKVVVDNVLIDNVYSNLYNSTTSDYTLKNKPSVGEVSVKTNNDAKTFTLSMDKDNVTDSDNAIVKYTYEIFEYNGLNFEVGDTEPVYSFSRSELDDEILKLDDTKNLAGNTDYWVRMSVQYYDNYRYNEIHSIPSAIFQVSGKPTISFEATHIDTNTIAGNVVFEDEDCTVPFEGRECSETSNDVNNFVIRYYTGSTSVRNTIDNVIVDSDNLTLSFELNGLEENTLYNFDVYADVDLHNGEGVQKGQLIGSFTASTTSISPLMMQNWSNNKYSYDIPISINTEMVSTSIDDTSVNELATITFNLYSGDVSKTIEYATPMASYTVNENVIENYYNKVFSINSNYFEYMDSETSELVKIDNLDVLKELSGGRLSSYYTIEVTDAYDNTGTNPFPITNNVYVYETPSILLLEDQVTEPQILVEEITNIETNSDLYKDYNITYNSSLDDEIIRGYKVTASYDKAKIENIAGSGAITGINFYVNGILFEDNSTLFPDTNTVTTYFFLGDGTDYNTVDKDLRRGNTYTFSFDLSIDDDSNPDTASLSFPSSRPTSDKMVSLKQAPLIKSYIDSSTPTSITYKYQIYDYDNALYMEEDKYYIYYSVNDSEELYRTEIVKDGSESTFTLSNLSNSSIYSIKYKSALSKSSDAVLTTYGNYFFDGYYLASDYNLGYKLEYGPSDNKLEIIISDNEFLNRVSAYLLTLDAGSEKYQTIVTNLSMCNTDNSEEESKCIVVDYKNISSLMGKDITVTLDAFYDTGYVGFSQVSRLGGYFENLNLVSSKDSSKVGFVYQNTGTTSAGKYFGLSKGASDTLYNISSLSDTPKGILGFELNSTDSFKQMWTINTSSMINLANYTFSEYNKLTSGKKNIIPQIGSINLVTEKMSINPKVLDVVSLASSDNAFKFTSITPKVSASVKSLINGAIMNISVSNNEETFDKEFSDPDGDGKYNFYIDIYKNNECMEDDLECTVKKELVKRVTTDYNSLSEVTFDGLDPDTTYSYKILADMNKNGVSTETVLFDMARENGYVEFERNFSTLGADKILDRVTYSYSSLITEETYSHRELKVTSYLKNKTNFKLKFELYDINGVKEYESITENNDINTNSNNVITASSIYDITGDTFVFGPNYHRLVITAITSDLEKELVIYDDNLVDSSVAGKNFSELDEPSITIKQEAVTEETNDGYNYGIKNIITVKDTDKVIKDGIYKVELRTASDDNACTDNPSACTVTVDIKNGYWYFDNNPDVLGKFDSISSNNSVVTITYDGLKADTNYIVYVSADTYRNNVSLGDSNKNGLSYVRGNQYTDSELKFSLGAVTPSVKSKNEVLITFAGASNLDKYLTGIEYSINIQGGGKVASGSLGTTLDSNSNSLTFGQDKDGYLTLSITTEQELGLNNYIIITYYYKNSKGEIKRLDLGGNTSYQYTVKNES